MNITAIVLSALLAAVFLGLGAAKVVRAQRMVDAAKHLGFSTGMFQLIGVLELCAVAGLVVGMFWAPLGVAAAIGLVALLVGAAIAHRRAGDDPRTLVPPAWLAVVSAAVAIIGVTAP